MTSRSAVATRNSEDDDVLRRLLLSVAASPRVKRGIEVVPLTRHVVDRFVAGDDVGDALAASRKLVAAGLLASIDRLGEATTDPTQAEATASAYIWLLKELADAGRENMDPETSEALASSCQSCLGASDRPGSILDRIGNLGSGKLLGNRTLIPPEGQVSTSRLIGIR